MSLRRRSLSASVLYALTVGCAVDGCDTTEPSADPIAAPTQLASAGSPAPAAGAAPALPVLSAQARAARVAAQERLLGRQALFEDLDGKPLPALEVAALGESFEDDLLDALPGSAGLGMAEEPTPGPAPNGNALGLYVPLEQPAVPALAHFHGALRRLAEGQDEDRKVRIALYGASHTQADIYPEYLRSYLQERFGDAGAGFFPLVPVNRWHRPAQFSLSASKRWIVEHAQRSDAPAGAAFGLLGASARTDRRGEWARLAPREDADETASGSLYEVFYLAQPGGGKFTISLDGEKKATVDTRATTAAPGYARVEVAPGLHTLEIRHRGGGEVRVFGVAIERADPGVVVDTLGIAGTRAANHLASNEPLWADNLRRRGVDLYALAYGTNETTDEDVPVEHYREQLVEVLLRFRRAAPEASCLLIGPGDVPRATEDGAWATRPRLLEILGIQREVAYEQGCAFWDGVAFMGGVGSMHTWASSRPPMASRDHIHLSRRGYVRMGMALADAIMAEYDRP